jgi:transcriptional regulator with XRE-family HTH domain
VGKPQREVDPFRDELREIRKTLGQRIRELRKLKGWSQEEFSDHAHIHRTFAGSLERGEKNVSFHGLALIARCFGITLSDLLAGIEAGESVESLGPASSRRRKNRGDHDSLDHKRILTEAMVLERTARTLREIAGAGERSVTGLKPPKKSTKPKG